MTTSNSPDPRRRTATLASAVFDDTLRQLDDFLRFEPNWDSYGAEAPDRQAIAAAKSFVAKITNSLPSEVVAKSEPYHISPLMNGGVLLEWKSQLKHLEIEVATDGTLNALLVLGDRSNRTFVKERQIAPERAVELVGGVVTA